VNNHTFPADFFILDMHHEKDDCPILLGRPFLKTAQTKIDVSNGSLSMEFDGERVDFNIYDAMRHPSEEHSLCSIDVLEQVVQESFDERC